MHLLTSIDVHSDAKMTLDVILTFVNWRQLMSIDVIGRQSIDVNWCHWTSIDAWRSRYYKNKLHSIKKVNEVKILDEVDLRIDKLKQQRSFHCAKKA